MGGLEQPLPRRHPGPARGLESGADSYRPRPTSSPNAALVTRRPGHRGWPGLPFCVRSRTFRDLDTSCLLGGVEGRVGEAHPLQLGLWLYLTQTGALARAAAPSFCVNEIPCETHGCGERALRQEGQARKATLVLGGTGLKVQGPPVL